MMIIRSSNIALAGNDGQVFKAFGASKLRPVHGGKTAK
jgi:hypothetical protein